MTKEQIEAKKQQASDQFDRLTQQKAEIESELLRLQGEYRGYEAMLKDLDEPEVKVKNEPKEKK